MPGLLELQRSVATGLLSGDMTEVAALVASGQVPSADRLQIHRNTMLTALANALQLTYPAVAALVGPAFFAQTARVFALGEPPRAALLSGYGGGFADFLAGYAPVAGLPYLPDVARLDWAVEQAAAAPLMDEAAPCAEVDLGGMKLTLAPSLTLLKTGFPAEAIWRAAVDDRGDLLEHIDCRPAPATVAIWRDGGGASVQALDPGPAAFVAALIAGGDAAGAITAATAADRAGEPISALTTQVLAAGFARLTPSSENERRLP